MKTVTKIHMAAYGLTGLLLGGGLAGQVHSCQRREAAEEARRTQITQTFERLKACPDRQKANTGCFSDEERIRMLGQAQVYSQRGHFERAGVLFAQLGEVEAANRMAGECKLAGNNSGYNRIRDELSIMREAMEKYDSLGLAGESGGTQRRRVRLTIDAGTTDVHEIVEEDAGAEDAVEESEVEIPEADIELPDAIIEESSDAGLDEADAGPEEADAVSEDAPEAEDRGRNRRDAGQRRRDAGRSDAGGQRETGGTPASDAGTRAEAARPDSGRTIIF